MHATDRHTIYVVEDDPSVRDALALTLGRHGYSVAAFADAESFLAAFHSGWHGCLLVDIHLPGMNGLALQKHLLAKGSTLPVVVMSGHGSVAAAREAFRAKAVDFIEKPIDGLHLVNAIEEALACQAAAQDQQRRRNEFERQLAELTRREKEVMAQVVGGLRNREIADRLGISPRTVEVHKARMMTKLGANGIPDLVRLSLADASPP